MKVPVYHGHWLKDSHQFVYADVDSNNPDPDKRYMAVMLYDADLKQSRAIADKLPESAYVMGASTDGKWVYLTSRDDLTKSEGDK